MLAGGTLTAAGRVREDAAVTTVEPYPVVARNIDPHADNRIHDDDVAQRFGFTGALVPGVEVFAYATSPLVAAWGPAFFTGGQVDLRFRRPVYDGERVVVTCGSELAVTGPDGVLRAVGTATAAGPLTPLDLGRYPLAPLPDIAGQDPVLGPFGTVEVPGDRSAAEQYLTDVGEPLGLYREQDLLHPGLLLRLVNLALMVNVELGPWIHTASACRFLAPPRVPEVASVRSVVTSVSRRGAHEQVRYDAVVLCDGVPVLEVTHTALYRLGI